jgi:hypothetical protein
MKFVSVVTALALPAVTAHADSAGRAIVAKAGELTFGPSTPPCPGTTLFQADFLLLTAQGDPLGTATSCVQGWSVGPVS